MKIYLLFFIFVFSSGLGFCQSVKTEKRADEVIIVTQKDNKKYNLSATFYGEELRYGENEEVVSKIITYVVFRDNKTNVEVKYSPKGTTSAADFYFTEIWSPDEEYLILPIGKFEGFGIFEAKDALKNVKSNKYFDTIKVKHEHSGWYWHDFEKWEDDSTFSFRAGLSGDMFAFKYNVAKSELYCYEEDCQNSDIGENNKGNIKATKRGDIAPTKLH